MSMNHTDFRLILLVLLSMGLIWVGLSGCASNSPGWNTADDLGSQVEESDARKRARLRLQLATGYFEQGQTSVALEEVRLALQIDSGFADAFNLRGLIYMRLNESRQAEDNFKRALSLNPKDPNTAHNLGWLLCQTNRFPEANQWFAQALHQPGYAGRSKTHLTQGMCQMRAGNNAEAEASLMRSYDLDASNPATAYNLGLLMFQRGQWKSAQTYLKRLNSSTLANAESLWLGIKVERRLEQMEAANLLGEQLRKRFPQSVEFSAWLRGAYDE
ncbi:MAG: type IV pilus biogenesis/stability protein PilW [Betaproteobacteria bacterium]|nr:type IV pilus biogenesis/stability protein PilW [Betaproteobacteria bacterium]